MTKGSPSSEVKQTNNKINFAALASCNRWLAGIFLLQGLLLALLSQANLYPVQANYLTRDFLSSEISGTSILSRAASHILEFNLLHLVVGLLVVAAVVHTVIATVCRSQYEADLKRRLNTLRWLEYALTGGVVVVAVGLITGIADLPTLLALFGSTVIAALAGLAMEQYNRGQSRPNWLAYIIGGLAALIPALIFAVYVWATVVYGSGAVPGFVYGLYATLAILGLAFAANMYLQFKQVGKWKDYAHVERMYLLVSVTAKTALVWQIFAGALRP